MNELRRAVFQQLIHLFDLLLLYGKSSIYKLTVFVVKESLDWTWDQIGLSLRLKLLLPHAQHGQSFI